MTLTLLRPAVPEYVFCFSLLGLRPHRRLAFLQQSDDIAGKAPLEMNPMYLQTLSFLVLIACGVDNVLDGILFAD